MDTKKFIDIVLFAFIASIFCTLLFNLGMSMGISSNVMFFILTFVIIITVI